MVGVTDHSAQARDGLVVPGAPHAWHAPPLCQVGRFVDRGEGMAMITVKYVPMTDRRNMFAVWLCDKGLGAPLLIGFVRDDLLSWIAKTREGHADVRGGFKSRTDAATWILLAGKFAQKRPIEAAAA